MSKYTGKELVATIKEFENGEDRELVVVNDSSWLPSKNSDNVYQKLRYYVKKLNCKFRVTRNYNSVILSK